MTQEPYPGELTAALNVIGGKWKVPILCELRRASRRFGELRRLIPGVSEKVLIQQLREMEADGVVSREIFDEVPPRVEYSLTAYGLSLSEALRPLGAWGAAHQRRATSTPEVPTVEARQPRRHRLPVTPAVRRTRPVRRPGTDRLGTAGLVPRLA
ncbi:winged helix-turn-helix transcriptional regulator [Micromonospora sp. URMC 105]|uniref:winged helix-turn-helix transcriptional regulator n=1 Tax=Micromonospora sp. URMC 105 TaxID=3423413 RepID=UPI003F19E1BC